MTPFVRHYLTACLLMAVAWGGSSDDRRRIEELQQRYRLSQPSRQVIPRLHPSLRHLSLSPHHSQHRLLPPSFPILIRTTPSRPSPSSSSSLEAVFSPANQNFLLQYLGGQPVAGTPTHRENRYKLITATTKNNMDSIPQRMQPSHLFHQRDVYSPPRNRYNNNYNHHHHPRSSRIRNTNLHRSNYNNYNRRGIPRLNHRPDKILFPKKHPVPFEQHQRSRGTILKDDPSQSQADYGQGQTIPEAPNSSSGKSGGSTGAGTIGGLLSPDFLDPAKFKLQDMDLTELQAAVDLIDAHIQVKDNDPSAYTGSRVLVLLLREQCFRLQASGDPDIEVFCQRFNNRFRSMLF